jgi:hypothetical protein
MGRREIRSTPSTLVPTNLSVDEDTRAQALSVSGAAPEEGRQMKRSKDLRFRLGAFLGVLALSGGVNVARAQGIPPEKIEVDKGGEDIPLDELLSAGGRAAVFGPNVAVSSPGEAKRGAHDNGRGGNSFMNDPCLDPPPEAPFPTNFLRTVQSEDEIAVLNTQGSMGKKMVAGYNDSWGFYDNTQGLSGYAYSIDGGNTWVDGGGLPPRFPTHVEAGTPGSDAYFGDPVLVVHQASQTFYYASIYQNQAGIFTLSVNRGRFAKVRPANAAPETNPPSIANTRCANDPTEYLIPDPPKQDERIYWELPVEAVLPPFLGQNNDAFLDKEWLYVDQGTGTLYLTYTRFEANGSTPIEMVRCIACAAHPEAPMVWTPPSVIVPNLNDTFNQATQAFTTPSGRVIVTWFSETFALVPPFNDVSQRIEYAVSNDDGNSFGPTRTVAPVNPQGEPLGYNRGRPTILNTPYIFVDRGSDDGVITSQETSRPGFGNVYIAYFSGKPPFGTVTKAADIFVSTSTDNGTTFGPPVKVNDDNTATTHVFPSVQANKNGDVYVAWLDRRQDPVANTFTDLYAAVSKTFGASFGHNKLQTDESTQWDDRADALPNFGDYNSSEMLGFNQFVTVWSDGRFPAGVFNLVTTPGTPGFPFLASTPDAMFTIANGLGVGQDPNPIH